MKRRIGGAHVQSFDGGAVPAAEPTLRFVTTRKAGCLKILNTALNPDAIRRFHENNPLAYVVYRRVAGDDLGGFAKRNEDTIRDVEPLRYLGDRLLVELAMNEAYQGGSDLDRLGEATVAAAQRFQGAGLRPVAFNFSVGNPQRLVGADVLGVRRVADLPLGTMSLRTPMVKRPYTLAGPPMLGAVVTPQSADWPRLVPAVKAIVAANGAIGLHEYGVPGAWDDGWHQLRYRRVREELRLLGVTGVKFVIGEAGIDRGIMDGHLAGWRDDVFHLSADQYATLVAANLAEMAKDPDVLCAAFFGAGAYRGQPPNGWESFEYMGEPAIEAALSAEYDTPDPVPPPPQESTVDYPSAIWHATGNFGYPRGHAGRNGQSIQAIVYHIAEGTEAGAISWFQNPASNASSTYFVCYDGRVLQFVREENAPWTNGIDFSEGYALYKSDLAVPWLKECWDKSISPNLRCVTIELEGRTGQPIPTAQMQAVIRLAANICERTGLARTRIRHIGHYQVDSVTRPNCPGSAFPWTTLLKGLGGTLPNPPTPAVPDNAVMERKAWSPVYLAAQHLFSLKTPGDSADANALMEILTRNKARHGVVQFGHHNRPGR